MLRSRGRADRLVGVDVARCLALVGMAATHVFPAFDGSGQLHPAFTVAAGRAAALFAVLAGVSLALASGGRGAPRRRALWAARAGVLARGGLLLGLGLLLARVDSPPLVILAYYGLLFAVATLVLGLPARTLAWLAVAAAVLTPLLSHWLRQYVAPASVAEPGGPGLAVELLLTGSYPVLTWTTYLLAGLAVGRATLSGWLAPVRLVVAGVLLAGSAKVASAALLAAVGGADRLRGWSGDTDQALARGLFGTTPRGDWRWLTVSAPHSGTTLDLAHTVGTSFAVLGACLLLARLVPRPVLLPLAAAGSMTLTLYTVHVLALAEGSPLRNDDPRLLWLAHVVVALVAATLWRTLVGRGPLEAVSALADRSARAVVSGRSRAVASRL